MTPEQFLELGDLLPDPLFLVAGNGQIQAANRPALQVLGLPTESVYSQLLDRFVKNEHEQLKSYLQLCSGSKQPLAGRLSLVNRNNEVIAYRCDGAVLRPASAGSSALICLRCTPRQTSNNQFVLLNHKIDELNHEIMEHQYAEEQVRKLNEELEQRIDERTTELKIAYQNLESFSYSVSHDLRAPLRSINGFSQALLEDYADRLDVTGQDFLQRVCKSANRMEELIDDILELSRISQRRIKKETVSLSQLSCEIIEQLKDQEPDRRVEISIANGIDTYGDAHLLRIVLDNLLNNSWKYTGKVESASIEFGELRQDQQRIFFVKDNGAGFDMRYADKLFGAFQRLHTIDEFEGNGIGLATVQRIINRHGGRIWADSEVDKGATFYFTLAAERQ